MIDIIREKLLQYNATNALEEENAVKEILQEVTLYALWSAGFFEVALFQGGTSLRILNNLPRFSEDLDFLLRTPNPAFEWAPYLTALVEMSAQFGLILEAEPKSRMDRSIRQALLKNDSIASQLNLSFAGKGRPKTVKIKLEIDVNPPAGSGEELMFLDFPADYEVRHQDLSSNFALKIHALLCRPYLKGRDWFDFSWYVARGTRPNLALLQAALRQTGPWSGQEALTIDAGWLADALTATINRIDWQEAGADVMRFLRPLEARSIGLWSDRFFQARLAKLTASLR
jgi:hypothetical protein